MTFEKTLDGLECNCIENCVEDCDNSFARFLGKDIDEVTEKTFNTHYEDGKMPKSEKCSDICTNRAVSISLINDGNNEFIINKFNETFMFSPKYKRYMIIIRFMKNAGILKNTRNNKFHYDFYKSDEFDLNHIEIINKIDLKRYV